MPIKQRGRLVVCANPNALPFSSKTGDRPGFELELAGEQDAGEMPTHQRRSARAPAGFEQADCE
jgi:hypothetical protein